jgi:hypothetical protein
MSQYHCSCGFANDDAAELGDHLLTVFTPEDDHGNDGREHAELVKTGETRLHWLVCLCGFSADETEEFDDHMLLVFTTLDGIGNDGKRHVVIDPSSASDHYVV